MEYFDLNLRPVLLNWEEKVNAVCNLIVNAIRQYHDQEYTTKLIVDYDEATSTLRIKDQGTGINLSDFVQKKDAANDWLANGLRVAISSLLASQIDITFKSNFGTFTPVIRNKEGLSENIASIFLAYEPQGARVNQWVNLKFVDPDQLANTNHGTEITISPLNANFVADLKYRFSFLLPWSETMQTPYGTLLINNQYVNDVFVDGENVTFMQQPEPTDEDQSQLSFSYDINTNAFEPSLISNRYNNIDRYIFKCIRKIYEELNDEQKEFVFSTLLNNHLSVEWNDESIRDYIIKFFANTNPDHYLIGQWESENANFVEFAKKANKEIIWVIDADEYNKVSKCGIESVYDFGLHYAAQNYTNFVDVNQLTAKEKTNWQALQSFLTYFVSTNQEVQNKLAKLNLGFYNIKIVENLPSNESFYLPNEGIGVINRKILSYKFSALLAGCKQIAFVPTGDISWDVFDRLWTDSIANFIIACQEENSKPKKFN